MRGRLLRLPNRPWTALAVLAVLVAIGLADWRINATPPDPEPADAPESAFSADRAWATVEAMAAEPHPMGSEAKDRVRDHLVEELAGLGFDVEVETELARDGGDGGPIRFGLVENIVATLPGTDPTGTVLLVSHYDSVPSGPGAADAASGVAALVESARALSLEGPQRNDLVVLLTDGEEMGLFGAEAYAREHPAGETPTVVFNLEARGVSGPSLMFETSADNAGLIEVFAESAPHPYGDSSAIEAYRQLPNDTDFTRFHEAGYVGLNNAFIGGAAWYHTPYDDTGHLSPASLQHHGANALGTARELVRMDLADLESGGDETFFGFLGAFVHYGEAWNLPLALLGLAAAAAAAVLARVRRLLSLPRLALALASFVLPLAVSAGLAAGLWPLLQALRPGYGDQYGLLFDRTWYYLAVLAVAVASLTAWYAVARRLFGAAAAALGPVLWLGALATATALLVPGVSFVFALPALAAVGILAAMALEPRSRRPRILGYAVFAASLVPAAVQVSWTANLMEAFGMELAAVPALLVVLFAAPALPLLALVRRLDGRALVPAAAGIAAVALVGAGLVFDRFDAEHPRQAYLSYVLDADTGTAAWVSADLDRSDWTAGYVTEDGLDGSGLPRSYADAYPEFGYGPAEAIAVEAPTARFTEATGDGATLEVESPRGADTMWLAVEGDVTGAEVMLSAGASAQVEVTEAPDGPDLVWFYNVPEAGFTLNLEGDIGAVTVFDQTHGLEAVQGYTERPEGLMRSRDRLSDTVTVAAAATG